MRALELTVALLATTVAVLSVRGPRPWLTLAAVVGALLLATLGSTRWQLAPGALALGLLAGVTLLQLSWPAAPTTLPRVTAVVVVLGLVTSGLLTWALPVPTLELEPGSGPIGTVAFDLVDDTRTSPSSRDAGEPRRITVQAWYPTDDDSGPRLRVTDEPRAFADAVSQFLAIPAFALTHLGGVRSEAHVGAPVIAPSDGLPVVLSLHGWGGFRFAQASLLEQLAADGHLVLAIDHTHGALAAQPVSGGVVPIDPRLLPNDVPPQVYDAAAMLLERTFADDAHALLGELRAGGSQVPAEVVAAADLDRLVVLGHSTGGGGATLLCAEDPCDAMVLFDPWVEPVPAAVREDGFAAPTLVLLSTAWEGNDNDRLLEPMVAASDETTLFVFEGTTHNDVTVQARLSPLSRRLGIAGEVPADRVDEVVVTATRSWIAATVGSGVGDPDALDGQSLPELRRR